MTKKDLIEIVAKKANLTNKASKEAIQVFLNSIRDSLKHGEKVVITGFGTFAVRKKRTKKGRNPHTGATITIPEHKTPGFTPGKEFRKSIK